MRIQQQQWSETSGWADFGEQLPDADLVLAFADTPYFQTPACFEALRARFPGACILGCSSAGSVLGTHLVDTDVVATAVRFDRARVRLAVSPNLQNTPQASASAGAVARELVDSLREDTLRHVLLLSDGHGINGSQLATGLQDCGLTVTGGLAGDGARFGTTWIMANAPAQPGGIAALGFYGDLDVRVGCFAGWQEFGPERFVTRASGNVVFEIDHQPALDLYQKYLGALAGELPASGLRFPLSVQLSPGDRPVIRTLLGIDENERSLRFAGDVPEGCLCQLMRTRLDDLIDSAGLAAEAASPALAATSDAVGLGLVVSCVGRRLVLGQLTEDELEAVSHKLGPATVLAGFYSYGELAPFGTPAQCQLHNQTMTLTTLCE